MDQVFRALGDETRRRILALVWDEERSAGDVAQCFRMSRPGVSQHLKVLLEAGVVTVRPRGTHRFYRANQDALRRVQAALAAYWDDRLRRLKLAAEAAVRERSP